MSKPTTITATYRIVTPMFCAGTNQQKAELRLASFKGALRFWWRTLMAGTYGGNIQKLYAAEARLFGSSEREFGQSKVRLRLIHQESDFDMIREGELVYRGKRNGLSYLGYGVMNFRGELQRPALRAGGFKMSIRVSQRTNPADIIGIHASLILLGSVGGLGSKSRKGYGSLSLIRMEENGKSIDISDDVAERLALVVTNPPDLSCEWTAWTRQSRVIVWNTRDEPLELLNSLGERLSKYRLWQGEGQSRFEDDHHSVFNYLNAGERPAHPPARIAFGLPHNYFFRSLSDREQRLNVKAEIGPVSREGTAELTRRGSPVMLHIDRCLPDATTAVVTFLPSKFLPDGVDVKMTDSTSKGRSSYQRKRSVDLSLPTNNFWKPVTDFMDELLADQTLNATEVKLG